MSDDDVRPVIQVRGLTYTYNPQSQRPIQALKGVDLDVGAGDYVVILGHNGSGKSTLARHLNALLRPTSGEVHILGLDTRDPANTLPIRCAVGMVFQVPDNQIVASIVEEDVAFGPENLGVPEAELRERVDGALRLVGLTEQRHREPHRLSAGQKQRVAIAGVVAMQPQVLVLDEATSMLDPEGRRDVLEAARLLHAQGVTIIAITHRMEEAVEADRVIVMEGGRIALEGPPREVFGRGDDLRALHLDVPQVTQVAHLLHERDSSFPPDLLRISELVDCVWERHASRARPAVLSSPITAVDGPPTRVHDTVAPLIEVCDLHYTHMRGTPLEATALRGASLEVYRGERVGIIGRAGAGKSTLVQHLNGLLRPREPGRVRVGGLDLADAHVDVRALRQKIGLVFQYPEQQLFERLVGDDVAFGPKQLGMPREERRERVRWAMEMVGLDFEGFKDRPTFALSGGEMRKAALAGVLALRPEVLILDESTSGLDPRSRRDLVGRLLALHRAEGLTLLFVSPSMEEVAELVERVIVMDQGRVAMSGPVREVFGQAEALHNLGLGVPQVTEAAHRLAARGAPLAAVPLTAAEGAEVLWKISSS